MLRLFVDKLGNPLLKAIESGSWKSSARILAVCCVAVPYFLAASAHAHPPNNPINLTFSVAQSTAGKPDAMAKPDAMTKPDAVERFRREAEAAIEAAEALMRDEELRKKINLEDYVTETVGLPTLNDIFEELAKPGRDPREDFEDFTFAEGIETLDDLQPGMKLTGIVTNVTAFGAFVDIGVHQDGLVHISQLADRYVKDPADIVRVGQKVTVTVLDVDLAKRRISLSMKDGSRVDRTTDQKQSDLLGRKRH